MNIVYEESFPLSSVDAVDMDFTSSDIKVNLWKDDYIKVIIYGSYDFPEIHNYNGILVGKDSGMFSSISRNLVQLVVPESFYASMNYGGWKLSTVNGNIEAKQLWGDEIKIETTNGNISLTKCEGTNLNVKNTNGDIILDNCYFKNAVTASSVSADIMYSGEAMAINLKTTSGDIQAKALSPLVMNSCLKSVSGNINLYMPENPGFRFSFETTSGNIANGFTGNRGGKTGIDIYGNGIPIIEASTVSGDININKI